MTTPPSGFGDTFESSSDGSASENSELNNEAQSHDSADVNNSTSDDDAAFASQVPDDLSGLPEASDDSELAAAQQLAAGRLDDLQRERASFTNYRNRSLRDQDAARTRGIEDVLSALLPVLDDIDRARQAGDLKGPFEAIAEKLDSSLGKFEIERFGAVGEEFDPNFHEALMHEVSADAESSTVKFVIEPGYRIGERVMRAARVAVVGPEQ